MNKIYTVLLLHISICAFGQENDVEQIKRLAAEFSENYMRKDFKALAEAYTEDAVLLSPGRDIIIGKANIYNFWAVGTSTYVKHTLVPEQIIVKGDEAHDFGYFYTQIKNSDGTIAPMLSSKYYVIWSKQPGGSWKMKMDMWNTRDRNWTAK